MIRILRNGIVIWGSIIVLSTNAATICYKETVGGITWTYTVANGVASVGSGSSSSPAVPKSTSGAITIPSALRGYSVTSVGDNAFYCCRDLTNVTIPSGVTSIGNSAFYCCSGLTSVIIPSNVTIIAEWAFDGCRGLTNVTIANSVTSIGGHSFYYCSGLTSLTIPDSVTSIGEWAFYGCTNLTSVMIGNGVTNIEGRAFKECNSLTNLVFIGNAPKIGYSAFSCVASDCHAYVRRTSDGWGVSIPGEWNGIAIDYLERIVVFDANGGEGGTNSLLDIGTDIVAPTVTRTGYTFKGWSPNVELTVPAHDVTHVAQWTPNKYTVTFDANGGTGGTVVQQDYESVIVVPTVARIGYTFKGWSPSVAATVPANDVTYTAQWEINKYTVTFNANGGVGGTSGKQDYGTAIAMPTVTRKGYTFKGWTPSVAETVPANDVTYTAQWEVNQYAVTFDANGGAGGISWKQDYSTAIVPPTVTRTGYTFKGWLPSVAATVPANDVTYTAQWEKNKYTLSFDANGGTYGTATTIVDYGTTVGELPVPTRTNATFLGWFTAAEEGTLIDGSTAITGAMTLYAHWLLLEEALDGGEGVILATSVAVPWHPILEPNAKVGDATARSCEIGDRTNTWLSATVGGVGSMSFWCKVSCEHDDDNTFTWDRLMVYTNDVEIVEWRMDGETDWTQRTLSFEGGTNTVKWVYFKDRSVSEGQDCAWVDGLVWTPSGPVDTLVSIGGKEVTVAKTWLEAHENIVRESGGDVAAALQSTAANGRLSNVECYVLGLDPEVETNDFKIVSFPMKADGTPDLAGIVFDPPQARWNVPATYKVMGAADLGGPWEEVPDGGGDGGGASGGRALPMRFFKVIVELP